FATDYQNKLVGPGIAEAYYGGAFFLFPPRFILDIWQDPRIASIQGLEDKLLAGAFLNSKEKHVALVSPKAPKRSWRQLAGQFGKKIIHLPLQRFSQQTVENLRRFHVLNGKEVRSYASEFIREM
ncbi:MAG: hypothetical protein QF886_26580, partial [Planctomycetota bacterium]|nr:hypothetical protein [Planctomycetota bacterium]